MLNMDMQSFCACKDCEIVAGNKYLLLQGD